MKIDPAKFKPAADQKNAGVLNKPATTTPQDMTVVPKSVKKPTTVDLLALIPKTDQRLSGQSGKRRLQVGKSGTIHVSYAPPEEYDLHVMLRRTPTPKNIRDAGFSVRLPVGTQTRICEVYIDGKYGYGFINLDGKGYHENEVYKKAYLFSTGRSHRVVYRVRRASISVIVNGKTIIDYKDRLGRLSLARDGIRRFGFGSHGARFELFEARLVPFRAARKQHRLNVRVMCFLFRPAQSGRQIPRRLSKNQWAERKLVDWSAAKVLVAKINARKTGLPVISYLVYSCNWFHCTITRGRCE
jgi:hypothetical protein